jgi:hypothetical protein
MLLVRRCWPRARQRRRPVRRNPPIADPLRRLDEQIRIYPNFDKTFLVPFSSAEQRV